MSGSFQWFVVRVVGISVALCLLHNIAVSVVVAVYIDEVLSLLLQSATKGRSPSCAAGVVVAWFVLSAVVAWGVFVFGVLVSLMLLVGLVVIVLSVVAVVVVVAAEFIVCWCVDVAVLVA